MSQRLESMVVAMKRAREPPEWRNVKYTVKDDYGVKKYLVVNADNVLQTSEYGMSLVETAAYAGIDTENVVEDIQNSEELSKIIMNATQKVLNGED